MRRLQVLHWVAWVKLLDAFVRLWVVDFSFLLDYVYLLTCITKMFLAARTGFPRMGSSEENGALLQAALAWTESNDNDRRKRRTSSSLHPPAARAAMHDHGKDSRFNFALALPLYSRYHSFAVDDSFEHHLLPASRSSIYRSARMLSD